MTVICPHMRLSTPFYEFTYEEFAGYIVYSLQHYNAVAEFYIDSLIKYSKIEDLCCNIYTHCKDNIICISVSDKNFLFAKILIRALKRYNPHVIVICIGEFSLFFAKHIIDITDSDYAIHGNSFYSIRDLYSYIHKKQKDTEELNKILGIAYKTGSEIFCNAKSDSNYSYFKTVSLIDSKIIPIHEIPHTGISFIRGCNQKCSYCQYSKLRNTIAKKNIDIVKKELFLLQTSDIRQPIEIRDENIDISKSYLSDIIKYFKKDTPFEFSAEMRIENYTDDLLAQLKVSNIKYLGVGIEAFDKKVIKNIKKFSQPIKWKNILDIYLTMVKKYSADFSFGINLILGLPGENIFTLIKNAYYINKYPFNLIVLNRLKLYQGTELFDSYPVNKYSIVTQSEYDEKIINFNLFRYRLFFGLIKKKLTTLDFNIDFLDTVASTKLLYLALIQKVNIACGTLQFIKINGKSNELVYNYNGESIKRIRFIECQYKTCYYVKSTCGIHYHELDIILFKNKYKITVRTRFSIIILSKKQSITLIINNVNPYIFVCDDNFIEYKNVNKQIYENLKAGIKKFMIFQEY